MAVASQSSSGGWEGGSAILKFTHDFGADKLKMIEVDESILEDLQSGSCVEMRGCPDDETVICTESHSYSIRTLETSNLQLVVKPKPVKDVLVEKELVNTQLEVSKHTYPVYEVSSALSCHYELTKKIPSTGRLKDILNNSVYNGPEEIEPEDLHTIHQLRKKIQISDKQLNEILKQFGALELNGYYRILSDDLKSRVVDEVLLIITEQDWSREKIPINDCIKEMDDYPPEIIRHCLRLYSDDKTSSESDDVKMDDVDDKEFIALSEEKLCRYCGLKTLSEFFTTFKQLIPHERFAELWEEALPFGMKPDFKLLKGYALQRPAPEGSSTMWQLFVEDKLSGDPRTRFQQLFKVLPQWTYEELEPYVTPLQQLGHSKDKMLMIHTRSARRKVNGRMTKVYFPRVRQK